MFRVQEIPEAEDLSGEELYSLLFRNQDHRTLVDGQATAKEERYRKEIPRISRVAKERGWGQARTKSWRSD